MWNPKNIDNILQVHIIGNERALSYGSNSSAVHVTVT
jgi:hypothetical protein